MKKTSMILFAIIATVLMILTTFPPVVLVVAQSFDYYSDSDNSKTSSNTKTEHAKSKELVDNNAKNFDVFESISSTIDTIRKSIINPLLGIQDPNTNDENLNEKPGSKLENKIKSNSDLEKNALDLSKNSIRNVLLDLVGDYFNIDYSDLDNDGDQYIFTIDYSILNRGAEDAGPFDVSFYLSEDEIISIDDILLELDGGEYIKHINGLDSGQVYSVDDFKLSVSSDIEDQVKGYYIGMIIDCNDDVEESDESNNTNVGDGIDWEKVWLIGWPPDLTVPYFDVLQNSLGVDYSFGLDFDISNNQNFYEDQYGNVNWFYVSFYLSLDDTINESDYLLDKTYLYAGCFDKHDGGEVQSYHIDLSLPDSDNDIFQSGDDVYYVGMVIDSDDDIIESNENNNAVFAEVDIKTVMPDLSGSFFDVTTDTISATDDSFYVDFSIKNTGEVDSGPFDVSFYLSYNDDIGDTYSNGYKLDLGVLDGADSSVAYAINNNGQVVGESGNQAFIWENGKMTGLGFLPGDDFSIAYDINESGAIVGVSSSNGGETNKAVLWYNGEITNITPAGAYDAYAYGINHVDDPEWYQSRVVGKYYNSTLHQFMPYYWQDEDVQYLNLPSGCIGGSAVSICDNNGYKAGYGWTADEVIGILWYGGDSIEISDFYDSNSQVNDITKSGHAYGEENGKARFLPLGDPNLTTPYPDYSSSAEGVNNNEEDYLDIPYTDVVGYYEDETGKKHGVFWKNDWRKTDAEDYYNLSDLIPPGWHFQHAYDINDDRQIVGYGTNLEGETHAYMNREKLGDI